MSFKKVIPLLFVIASVCLLFFGCSDESNVGTGKEVQGEGQHQGLITNPPDIVVNAPVVHITNAPPVGYFTSNAPVYVTNAAPVAKVISNTPVYITNAPPAVYITNSVATPTIQVLPAPVQVIDNGHGKLPGGASNGPPVSPYPVTGAVAVQWPADPAKVKVEPVVVNADLGSVPVNLNIGDKSNPIHVEVDVSNGFTAPNNPSSGSSSFLDWLKGLLWKPAPQKGAAATPGTTSSGTGGGSVTGTGGNSSQSGGNGNQEHNDGNPNLVPSMTFLGVIVAGILTLLGTVAIQLIKLATDQLENQRKTNYFFQEKLMLIEAKVSGRTSSVEDGEESRYKERMTDVLSALREAEVMAALYFPSLVAPIEGLRKVEEAPEKYVGSEYKAEVEEKFRKKILSTARNLNKSFNSLQKHVPAEFILFVMSFAWWNDLLHFFKALVEEKPASEESSTSKQQQEKPRLGFGRAVWIASVPIGQWRLKLLYVVLLMLVVSIVMGGVGGGLLVGVAWFLLLSMVAVALLFLCLCCWSFDKLIKERVAPSSDKGDSGATKADVTAKKQAPPIKT